MVEDVIHAGFKRVSGADIKSENVPTDCHCRSTGAQPYLDCGIGLRRTLVVMNETQPNRKTEHDPLHHAFEMSFLGLNASSQVLGPCPRAMVAWQLELFGLSSRMTRTWWDYYQGVAKSPDFETLAEQQSILVTRMTEHCAKSSERIYDLWSAFGVVPDLDAVPCSKKAHDLIDPEAPCTVDVDQLRQLERENDTGCRIDRPPFGGVCSAPDLGHAVEGAQA